MTADDPALAWAADEKRRRRRRLLIALAGVVACAAAIVALVAGYREVDFPEIERPLLWRVTSPAGKTSYLFGTIHIGYSIDELPKAVLDSQAEAAITVLESDLLGKAPAGSRPAARSERLRPEEWKALSELSGRPVDELQRFDTPYLLGAALVGASPRKREAMDKGLQKRALELGKPIEFLLVEATRGEQALELMPETETLENVRQVLANPERIRNYLQSMINAYGRGEESAATALPLLGILNEAWIEPIDDYMDEGGAFVAIGVAHLTGDHSIRTWLERRGHRIERWPW
ncbi:MAG: TraB/GumN family protein [Deltaproteobacteria bacterium]|nr:TraB/GumN family protein [Deltaproteobacteria bacterium]